MSKVVSFIPARYCLRLTAHPVVFALPPLFLLDSRGDYGGGDGRCYHRRHYNISNVNLNCSFFGTAIVRVGKEEQIFYGG